MMNNIGPRPCCTTPSTSTSGLSRWQERPCHDVSDGTVSAAETTTLQQRIDEAQARFGRDTFEPQGGASAQPQKMGKAKGKVKANGKGKAKGGQKQKRHAPDLGFGESTGASLVRARRLGQSRVA